MTYYKGLTDISGVILRINHDDLMKEFIQKIKSEGGILNQENA